MSMKMLKSKSAQAFNWVYGLVSLFGIGLMYVVFLYVFNNHLVIKVKDLVRDSDISQSIKDQVLAGIDKYLLYFEALPFVLFFVVVIYMIVSAIRKESGSEFTQ